MALCDHFRTRITDGRHACVRDYRNVLSALYHLYKTVGTVLFVEFVIGYELCVNVVFCKEGQRVTRVLASYNINISERFERTKRDVRHVADRSSDNIEFCHYWYISL